MEIYTTAQAAKLLNLSISTVKYHLYVARDLKADLKAGHTLLFSRKTLDKFTANKRKPGRPKKALASS